MSFWQRITGVFARPVAHSGAEKPPAVGNSVAINAPRSWNAAADHRFRECVAIVLKHEGGFVDHPDDPGGATQHGISLRYARTLGSMLDLDRDGDVDRADILLVTPGKAAMVYRDWFWRDVKGDELPPGIDLVAFDFAVNSGAGRAIRSLQRAVGAQPDGFIGPATLGAVRMAEPQSRAVIEAVCNDRLTFLRGLRTWPVFGRGWATRVEDVRRRALVMAS